MAAPGRIGIENISGGEPDGGEDDPLFLPAPFVFSVTEFRAFPKTLVNSRTYAAVRRISSPFFGTQTGGRYSAEPKSPQPAL